MQCQRCFKPMKEEKGKFTCSCGHEVEYKSGYEDRAEVKSEKKDAVTSTDSMARKPKEEKVEEPKEEKKTKKK